MNSKVIVLTILGLLAIGAFASAGGTPFATASNSSSQVNKPVFVWIFGYTGNAFYPQSQLGVSPAQTISIAQQISAKVGKNNLRLVCVLGLEGGSISSGAYTTEHNYVNSLKQYASVVYARIDLEDYSTSSLMANINVLVNTLGVNGIWLDEGPHLWQSMGSGAFNTMMQNIVNAHPSINILMNQAVVLNGYITPAKGTTWGSHTWISPSVDSGSCCTVNTGLVNALNNIYPGRVLVHFDAFAQVNTEPMGIFANQGTSTELSEIKSLASQAGSHNFDFMFPVLGAWTYKSSSYHGTEYNALGSGKYDRNTFNSFLSDMTLV
jgi:hypothetical protein